MTGCEHFTFHMGGPTEVMQAGTRFVENFTTVDPLWGPGRHRGSIGFGTSTALWQLIHVGGTTLMDHTTINGLP
jgi:hypothetical protein